MMGEGELVTSEDDSIINTESNKYSKEKVPQYICVACKFLTDVDSSLWVKKNLNLKTRDPTSWEAPRNEQNTHRDTWTESQCGSCTAFCPAGTSCPRWLAGWPPSHWWSVALGTSAQEKAHSQWVDWSITHAHSLPGRLSVYSVSLLSYVNLKFHSVAPGSR